MASVARGAPVAEAGINLRCGGVDSEGYFSREQKDLFQYRSAIWFPKYLSLCSCSPSPPSHPHGCRPEGLNLVSPAATTLHSLAVAIF
jgi:hypothetical protein